MEPTPPVMGSPGPGGVAPRRYLIVVLEEGWCYDKHRRAFVHGKRERFSLLGHLPKHSRVVPLAAELAARDTGSLSEDEGRLARTLNIVMPVAEGLAQHLEEIRGWDCVAEAWLSPGPALP